MSSTTVSRSMGIYDRDYVREERRGFNLGGDRTMVTNLILINVAIYFADFLSDWKLAELMAVRDSLFHDPWHFWQLLTAGFAHDKSVLHVGLNMFGLWLFGRDVEIIYGRWEFLRIYLVLVVLSSLAWVVVTNLMPADPTGREHAMIGASGAVTGIMMLFVLHYPRRTFLLWGVLPMPAWAVCGLFILQDIFGWTHSRGEDGDTAYSSHLAGAALAFIYYRSGISLGRFIPSGWSLPSFKFRPKLRVHDPDAERSRGGDLAAQVDRILEKLHEHGQDSLTEKERETLEDASRRYQRRRG